MTAVALAWQRPPLSGEVKSCDDLRATAWRHAYTDGKTPFIVEEFTVTSPMTDWDVRE